MSSALDPHDQAQRLLRLLERDCERLESDDKWASVVIWTAHEAQREAEKLGSTTSLAAALRTAADRAIALVRQTRSAAGRLAG